MYLHTYINTHIYIYIYIFKCATICNCTCVYACVWICVYIYIHTCLYMHLCCPPRLDSRGAVHPTLVGRAVGGHWGRDRLQDTCGPALRCPIGRCLPPNGTVLDQLDPVNGQTFPARIPLTFASVRTRRVPPECMVDHMGRVKPSQMPRQSGRTPPESHTPFCDPGPLHHFVRAVVLFREGGRDTGVVGCHAGAFLASAHQDAHETPLRGVQLVFRGLALAPGATGIQNNTPTHASNRRVRWMTETLARRCRERSLKRAHPLEMAALTHGSQLRR